jgi:ATP-dependent RNA helicase DeaD
MTSKLFSELGLSPALLKAIDQLGYEKAAPIQSEAIPLIMAGHDVIGQSQTGSGKTAAFGIPAVELVEAELRAVQVIVLCPTRELAVQVAEEIFRLSAFKSGVHVVPIYGGQSYDRQIRGLQQGAQIVVGTPGRILDHIGRGTLKLDRVKMVVLDEADEMLDMGFRDDIEQVLKNIPSERQFICFSATMAKAILELIHRYAHDPKGIRIEHKVLTVPSTEQAYCEIRGRSKTEALTRLIDLHDLKLGIIFCNTKRMVDDLTDALVARGYSADRIHGDMSQAQRDRVMAMFRGGGLEFLVATDVAARGIDVDNIEVVFNFELPWDEEDYVHRIGRTGRAGKSGRAFSLVAGREIYKLQSIERYIRTKIVRQQVPSLDEVEEKRTNLFFERIRSALERGTFEREANIVDRLLEQGFSSTDIACAVIHELRGEDARPAEADQPEPTARPHRDENAFHKRPKNRKPRQSGFRKGRTRERGG